jgi:hypothetical protein
MFAMVHVVGLFGVLRVFVSVMAKGCWNDILDAKREY